MARNANSYGHFCVVARTLEQLGDRWTLLIVRDLLTGPKRFTDLMTRLATVTPTTLSRRLRELEDAGLVVADRQAGRREVYYALSDPVPSSDQSWMPWARGVCSMHGVVRFQVDLCMPNMCWEQSRER